MTEKELIAKCQAQDREAQRELYVRTADQIYRLHLKLAGNPDDASDLTQQTYLKAFGEIHRFNGRAAVSTWLYRIAVNEALQVFRRARARRLHEASREDPASAGSDPMRATTRLDVKEALGALSETDRAILLLRYHEGLDYGRIAAAMACAGGTVASRLNRARSRLRALLRDGYGGGEENQAGEHPIPKAGCDTAPGDTVRAWRRAANQ